MKKFIGVVLGFALSLSVLGFGVTIHNQKVEAKEAQVLDEEVSHSNVGDGEEYAYVITEVNGDEINGVPLTKASDENRGIFLLADEVSFDVKVGDQIIVVWGEYEDEFKSIERALIAEDGSVVPESFYH